MPKIRSYSALALTIMVSSLCVVAGAGTASAVTPPDPVVVPASSFLGCPATCLEIPRGGETLSDVKVHLVFWSPPGTSFAPGIPNGDAQHMALVQRLFDDLSGSEVLNIVTQYGDGFPQYSSLAGDPERGYPANRVRVDGTYVETRAFPQLPLSSTDITAEITQAATTMGWPLSPEFDTHELYFVFTPAGVQTCLAPPFQNQCSGTQFAGYHDYYGVPVAGSVSGTRAFAYISTIGAGTSAPYPNNSYVDPVLDTTWHELTEALTQPFGAGWETTSPNPNAHGAEMADLCQPSLTPGGYGARGADGANVTVNGHRYLLQRVYSNAGGGCTLGFHGQFLNFRPLGAKTTVSPPFTLTADATSRLPVSYVASGACMVDGALVTITGGGTCTITANQSGDRPAGGFYLPATPVTQSFPVSVVDDFSIAAGPAIITTLGGTGSSSISTAVTSGNPGGVALTVSGVPDGATAGLSPTSVTAGGSSTLSVNAGTAGTGSYPLTVTGVEGGQTHTADVMLTIRAAPLVTADPVSQTVQIAQTYTFTADASGSPAPMVRWQASTDAGLTFSDIPGATTTAYSAAAAVSDTGHQFRAVFTNAAGTATSAAATLTVRSTAVALTTSLDPSTVGQSVTLSSQVSEPGTAAAALTGTMRFYDGGTLLSTRTVVSGKAKVATAVLHAGSHLFTAVYDRGVPYAFVTSPVVTQSVLPAATTVTLTSSANPSVFSQPVTLKAKIARVAPGARSVSTGSVSFYDGPTLLATVAVKSGAATAPANRTLPVASHPITATYTGSIDDLPSATVNPLTQVVDRAATVTTLSTSRNPAVAGVGVVVRVKVGSVAPAVGAITGGMVTFFDGATVVGTVALVKGVATLPTMYGFSVGGHLLTAVYDGTARHIGSTSTSITETIT